MGSGSSYLDATQRRDTVGYLRSTIGEDGRAVVVVLDGGRGRTRQTMLLAVLVAAGLGRHWQSKWDREPPYIVLDRCMRMVSVY